MFFSHQNNGGVGGSGCSSEVILFTVKPNCNANRGPSTEYLCGTEGGLGTGIRGEMEFSCFLYEVSSNPRPQIIIIRSYVGSLVCGLRARNDWSSGLTHVKQTYTSLMYWPEWQVTHQHCWLSSPVDNKHVTTSTFPPWKQICKGTWRGIRKLVVDLT